MEINKINSKEQFLKTYVKEASLEQLQRIDSLLCSGDYKQINEIIEEYTNRLINNEDLKEVGDSSFRQVSINSNKKEVSTEDMDPQAFELYCILMLIDQYVQEQDEDKKKYIDKSIQAALEKYRASEEVSTVRGR